LAVNRIRSFRASGYYPTIREFRVSSRFLSASFRFGSAPPPARFALAPVPPGRVLTAMASTSPTPLNYKLAVLVFLENATGELLLILRNRPPNLGVWSPIGGKLEMGLGESPFECAVRETREETGSSSPPPTCTSSASSPKKPTRAKRTG